MAIDKRKIFVHRLVNHFRYQSINCYRLLSIIGFIDWSGRALRALDLKHVVKHLVNKATIKIPTHLWCHTPRLSDSSSYVVELDESECIVQTLQLVTCDGQLCHCHLLCEIPLKIMKRRKFSISTKHLRR